MSLLKAIKKLANQSTTENGDINFLSTFNSNLDFFGKAGSMRGMDDDIILDMFLDAYEEDESLAIKNIFYLRDIRSGLGERDSFRVILSKLSELKPENVINLIPAIIEYGRFDDLLVLLKNNKTKQKVADYIKKILEEDLKNKEKGKPISLCAKWLPSINASSYETRKQALILSGLLGLSHKDYRKMLSILRNGLIIENKMVKKDYSFEYDKIPGRAMNKYHKAFVRNDEERFEEYLNSLKHGEKTIKVKTLFPHEIVKNVRSPLAEEQWKALDRTSDKEGKTIVVRDGSGSMYGSHFSSVNPIDVANALSILFSEQLTGEFANKFITFSSRPQLVDLSTCKTLKDKVEKLGRYNEVSNTDILKTYRLILNASKNCSPEDYIKRIVIISDMQFDAGTSNVPTFDTIKKEFDDAGIPFPEIVYWDVAGKDGFPTTDIKYARFVSGASQFVIKSILENKSISAVDYMNQVLDKYNDVVSLYFGKDEK